MSTILIRRPTSGTTLSFPASENGLPNTLQQSVEQTLSIFGSKREGYFQYANTFRLGSTTVTRTFKQAPFSVKTSGTKRIVYPEIKPFVPYKQAEAQLLKQNVQTKALAVQQENLVTSINDIPVEKKESPYIEVPTFAVLAADPRVEAPEFLPVKIRRSDGSVKIPTQSEQESLYQESRKLITKRYFGF